MAYVPNSIDMYTAAFAGALAALRVSERQNVSAVAADYAGSSVTAGAWAQALDTAWASPTANALDVEQCFEASYARFAECADVEGAPFSDPTTYATDAAAIVALIQAAEAYFATQGIVPNGWGNSALTGRTPWTATAFFVDPKGSVPGSSDSNTGAHATNVPPGTGPIRTTVEFNKRIYAHNVGVAAVVTYLSDDDSGTLLDLSTVSAFGGSLTFQGTPVVLHSGTFSAVTAIDPTTNQAQTVTDGVFNFASLIGNIVVDLTGGNAGVSAPIMFGTTSPELGPPMATDFTRGTFTNGDSYQVQRGSHLTLAPNLPFLGNVTFQDFSFLTGSIGPNADQTANFFVDYIRCQFVDFISTGGIYVGCYAGQGVQSFQSVQFLFGGLVTTHFDTCLSSFETGDDVYITGFGLILGPVNYQELFMSPDSGFGMQIHHTTSSGALWVMSDQDIGVAPGGGTTQGLLWGKNNAGVGLLVGPGACATLPSSAPNQASLTGADGDIGFVDHDTSTLITTARKWDEGGGTYSAPTAATWPNLYGAGLSGNAHNVGSNALVFTMTSF